MVPGIPVLGLLPENVSMWTLIVVLLPIGAGALAGWMVRSRLVWEGTPLSASFRMPTICVSVNFDFRRTTRNRGAVYLQLFRDRGSLRADDHLD